MADDTPVDDEYKRTTVTIPMPIYKTGLANAEKRGFKNSFSAYVSWLIERDEAGAVSRETTEPKILRRRPGSQPPR